jgi:hypothetical protein
MGEETEMQHRLKVDAISTVGPVPWWQVGVMWLFVGGLGAVVVGSFMLLATALQHADVVLPQVAVVQGVPNTSTSPALSARNHAATPVR